MSQETKNNNTNKANEQKAQTKNKKEKRADRKKQKQEARKYVRRLIPIWAKVMIVVLLSLFALMIGLIIGFSILGDGSPLDVLKWETWQHIIDYVKGD